MSVSDVIDHLACVELGGPVDLLRRARPVARHNMQESYRALFEPATQGDVTPRERHAIAAFVTGLHREGTVSGFYAAALAKLDYGLAEAVAAEVEAGETTGPYGDFPAGPLSGENTAGLDFRARCPDALGARVTAALEHAHMLVFHPRDSNAAWLQRLLDAGWSTSGIVTQSQLVAFLAFQVRVVHGLRTLALVEGN